MFFHATYKPHTGVMNTMITMTGKQRSAVMMKILIMIGARRIPTHHTHIPKMKPHWKFSLPTKKSNIFPTDAVYGVDCRCNSKTGRYKGYDDEWCYKEIVCFGWVECVVVDLHQVEEELTTHDDCTENMDQICSVKVLVMSNFVRMLSLISSEIIWC